jgi:thioredoxin reductase (NADPH)
MDQESHDDRPAKVTIYGRAKSPQAYSIREFLYRCEVPFDWIEVRDEAQARALGLSGPGDPRLPLAIFADGTRMESPTMRQLIEKLGWFRDPSQTEYDLAIYGAGPAGLSAAVYGASEGLKTVVVERSAPGGQAGSSPKIENYLGFPKGISGADLTDRAREQATRFGAEILLAREGMLGEFAAGKRIGYLADGTRIVARCAIIATGIDYHRLPVPDEEKFRGAGVYYGAGASEASLCVNAHVFIVGGANSAAQAALQFAKFARRVTMIVRGDSLKSTVSAYLVDRITSNPVIEVLTNSEVTSLTGDDCLRAITVTNRKTNERQTFETPWLFVCIGGAPRTDWAKDAGVARDEAGYLVTGPELSNGRHAPASWPLDRAPYFLETNIPGLFAAGDVRHGSVKRVASAVGEGAMAVTFVHRYLSDG